MEEKLIATLIDVHNKLLQISVKGDDVIRLGEVIIELRNTLDEATKPKVGMEMTAKEAKTNGN